jgi:hypothetical protein
MRESRDRFTHNARSLSRTQPAGVGMGIRQAVPLLAQQAARFSPELAAPLTRWMRALAPGASLASYFTGALEFPVFALPWWMEQSIRDSVDTSLQKKLIYSTVCGSYYIRLIDDIMDVSPTATPGLLPACAFLLSEFERVYRDLFSADHPFWPIYRQSWIKAAGVTIEDATSKTVPLARFLRFSALKTSAAKIPLAAICFQYRRPEMFAPWAGFCEAYGRFAQMLDDVFDWHHDDQRQPRSTYFLTVGAQRKRRTESLADWVFREGFDWGIVRSLRFLNDARRRTGPLGSKPLAAFIVHCIERVQSARRSLLEDLRECEKAMALLMDPRFLPSKLKDK